MIAAVGSAVTDAGVAANISQAGALGVLVVSVFKARGRNCALRMTQIEFDRYLLVISLCRMARSSCGVREA